MKTETTMFSQTVDVIDLIDNFVMCLSSLCFTVSTLHIMPAFVPNQFMLEKHSDKGTFDWEVYAWCLRDAIAKHSGLEKTEQSYKEKIAYERFMYGITDSVSWQNRTYHHPEARIEKDIFTPLL